MKFQFIPLLIHSLIQQRRVTAVISDGCDECWEMVGCEMAKAAQPESAKFQSSKPQLNQPQINHAIARLTLTIVVDPLFGVVAVQ